MPHLSEPTAPAAVRQLISLDKAAEYLDISPRTLSHYVALRQIEFVRVGRLSKFTQAGLDRWVAARTIAPRRKET